MTDRKHSHDPAAREREEPGTPVSSPAAADAEAAAPASERAAPTHEGPMPPLEPAAAAPAAEDCRDRWLRAEAELQTFRRRATRDWEEGRRNAEESVLLEMVAALDDLDRALESSRAANAGTEWTQGVALVAQRMRDYLARQGVIVEDPAGRPFDPRFHDAMLETDAPEGTPPGSVVQVVQKGYRRGDRALRAARVVVSRTESS